MKRGIAVIIGLIGIATFPAGIPLIILAVIIAGVVDQGW